MAPGWRHRERYVSICEDPSKDWQSCKHDMTYSLIFFLTLFTLFALLDCATLPSWRMNRSTIMNLYITSRDLACIAIVAFFCADIGLDVMRDSRYAVSSGWWHLSWVVIVAISLIAKLGPALICCLPSWATRQSFGNANNKIPSFSSRRGLKGRDETPSKGHLSSAHKKFKEDRKFSLRRRSTAKMSPYAVPEESSSSMPANSPTKTTNNASSD